MLLSSTTRYVPIESGYNLADPFILGIQRGRKQNQEPYPVAYQAEGQYDGDNQRW